LATPQKLTTTNNHNNNEIGHQIKILYTQNSLKSMAKYCLFAHFNIELLYNYLRLFYGQ